MQVWDLPTVRVWNVGVYAVRHLYPIKMQLNSDADLMYNFTSISTMERQKKISKEGLICSIVSIYRLSTCHLRIIYISLSSSKFFQAPEVKGTEPRLAPATPATLPREAGVNTGRRGRGRCPGPRDRAEPKQELVVF